MRCASTRLVASRRGSAAVLAMLFLVILSTLSLAMFSLSTTNVQAAAGVGEANRARAAAESGLAWMNYRLTKMARPRTTIGHITPAVADALWPSIRSAIVTDLNSLTLAAERGTTTDSVSITSKSISLDVDGGTFVVMVRQHPLSLTDPLDQRWLRVSSTGRYGEAERTISIDFKIDKKVRFAVAGRVPIQLGRNTLIEGPVAMATSNKFPPVLMLSDFTHFHSGLATKINAFETFLEANADAYGGRVNTSNATLYNKAKAAGFTDYNADGAADEFDIFLQQFDKDGDKAVTKTEFTNPSTGKLYDENLFAAIDGLGPPLFDGDVTRTGFNDAKLDARDAYARVRGQLVMAATASAWKDDLGSSMSIHDMLKGPIVSESAALPVRFGASSTDMIDLSPANFEAATNNFRAKSGAAGGVTSKTSTRIANKTLAASDANAGTVSERTPYGSTTYQATYTRPVFRNLTLKNVIVPKGLNALFDNCKFEGVTFVDLERNITSGSTVTTNSNDGMTWAQRMKSGSFNKDTALTNANSYGSSLGNNVRFNNCTFNGPLASGYSTAYTHFANSWEFTGATLFDNLVDDTATLVAPQTNIEMGSFTNPGTAPSKLIGVVVAGNIDIRGTSVVDGSVIVTGDGAGNTTLGYFGPSDGDTNAGALPEGGFGRLNIRYNPNRVLPDGIDVAIDLTADQESYREE